MSGSIFVITGPSGVGKSSIAKKLLQQRPNLKKVVTYTTRPIREGETDEVSYNFINRENFQRLIKKGAMFEWDKHYGNFYGSLREDVKALMGAGKDVLFVVNVAGAKTIKKKNPEATVFFIEAESEQQLFNRITNRDKGKTTGLKKRKDALKQEMAFANTADYRIINKEGRLDETVTEVSRRMDA